MAVMVFCHSSRSYFTGIFLEGEGVTIEESPPHPPPFLFEFEAGVDSEFLAGGLTEGLGPLGLARVLLALEGLVAF